MADEGLECSVAAKLHDSYRSQSVCSNCEHCHTEVDYEYSEYYCGLTGPSKPATDIELVRKIEADGEWPTWTKQQHRDFARIRKLNEKDWKAWKEGRSVDENGVCDHHKRKLT